MIYFTEKKYTETLVFPYKLFIHEGIALFISH